MNPPNYRKNTINQYSIQEEKVLGLYEEDMINYDLLTALIICLGDADDKEATGILRLLEVLLSTERSTEEKKTILQEDFDIKMTQELEREVSEMCNLSEGIEQKTILSAIRKLMSSTGWNIVQAMDALQIPPEERNGYLNMLKK